jgi:hypothetical protein
VGEMNRQLLAVSDVSSLHVSKTGNHLLGHPLLHRRYSPAKLSSGASVRVGNLESYQFFEPLLKQPFQF